MTPPCSARERSRTSGGGLKSRSDVIEWIDAALVRAVSSGAASTAGPTAGSAAAGRAPSDAAVIGADGAHGAVESA